MAHPEKGYGQIAKETVQAWMEDNATTLEAAVAYYAIFSLAPVLILVVAIAGLVYGRQAAEGQLAGQIQSVGAETIQAILANASAGGGGVIATVSSIVLVMVGASAVFAQLQMSFNRIWNLQIDLDAGTWATIRQRLLGLVMAFGLGAIVIVTIVVGTFLSNIQTFVQDVPAGQWV